MGKEEMYLLAIHIQASKNLVQEDLLNRLLPLLTERKVPKQNRRVKAQSIHILTRRRIHFPSPSQHRTLRLRLSWRNNVRDAHALQKTLTLRIMFPRDPNRSPREFLHILRRASLFGFLESFGGSGFALESLRQLARFELGGRAVEDVEGLNAIVDDAEGPVEHTH